GSVCAGFPGGWAVQLLSSCQAFSQPRRRRSPARRRPLVASAARRLWLTSLSSEPRHRHVARQSQRSRPLPSGPFGIVACSVTALPAAPTRRRPTYPCLTCTSPRLPALPVPYLHLPALTRALPALTCLT